jgi:hypothetical protein
MKAQAGGRIVISSRARGEYVREGVVREVHGAVGDPPYVAAPGRARIAEATSRNGYSRARSLRPSS